MSLVDVYAKELLERCPDETFSADAVYGSFDGKISTVLFESPNPIWVSARALLKNLSPAKLGEIFAAAANSNSLHRLLDQHTNYGVMHEFLLDLATVATVDKAFYIQSRKK